MTLRISDVSAFPDQMRAEVLLLNLANSEVYLTALDRLATNMRAIADNSGAPRTTKLFVVT